GRAALGCARARAHHRLVADGGNAPRQASRGETAGRALSTGDGRLAAGLRRNDAVGSEDVNPHACGCRRCAAPRGGPIRASGRPYGANDRNCCGGRVARQSRFEIPPRGHCMIVLYGSQGSGAAIAEVALDITGVPYRSVQAASWKPEERAGLDELRRVNPLAQIPTLALDDGSVLTESAAILIELGLRYPHSGLLPAAADQRAQVIRGLVYV